MFIGMIWGSFQCIKYRHVLILTVRRCAEIVLVENDKSKGRG